MSSIQLTHEMPGPCPNSKTGLSPFLVFLFALSAGLAVATLYYCQPMLGHLGADIGADTRAVGLIPTLTQLGYAAGLLLLAPLGDRHDRRKIILIKGALLCLALFAAAYAPGIHVLWLASLIIGLTATLTQDVVPAAASLTPEAQRGKIVGSVMTGVLMGILLSRVISGFVAEHFSWRVMFLIAALSLIFIGLIFWRFVPRFAPTTDLPYAKLMASLVTLWQKHRELRRAAWAQALLSAGFSAFWSTLAIMLYAAPFHLGSAVAGAFGLAGAVGAFAAPLAGHIADQRGPELVTRIGCALAAIAFAVMSLSPLLSPTHQLWLIAIGAVVFDLGMQATTISHQTVIYRLEPAARSRLNAVLFVGMFVGMASGAAIGSLLLAAWGWVAVTGFAAAVAGAAWIVRMRG